MSLNNLYQNKEWMINQYISLRKSIQQIANKINIGKTTIDRWLIKFNIPKRSYSEANKGKNIWLKGKKLSENHKKKLSDSNKGKHNHWRENNPNWKGGKRITKDGYILIKKRDHPFCSVDGYMLEHRLVIENFLEDYISPKNIVHHINGKRDDNKISNLILFKNQIEHTKYHHNLRGGGF